ncbi:hypothetical protein M8J75_005757 [Diaphorina citri]|nr:hypothetical protein M8J75_005757 [Diaphorina citri]
MILEEDTPENSCYCCAKTLDEVPYYESLLRHTLIKRLKDSELETLVEAIESHGTNMSPCILLPSHLLPNAHFLCCQLWRWPDVSEPYELKKLPNCDSYECSDPSPSSSDLYICCNPYHWSRRCKSDSPPPPYRRFSNERLKPEDKAPSESDLICDHISRQIELRGSLTTNGEGHQIVGPREESKSSHVHNDYLPAAATYQVGTFCLVLSLDHD